ncbi:hypothetical protein JCM11641_001929 [Rhodosporidiobolus odoratus]
MAASGQWNNVTRPLPPEPRLGKFTAPDIRRRAQSEAERERRLFQAYPSSFSPPRPSDLPQPPRLPESLQPRPPSPPPPMAYPPPQPHAPPQQQQERTDRARPRALPASAENPKPNGPLLLEELHRGGGPRIGLDPTWPGFPISAMHLGALDERGFESFASERDVQIHRGLLMLDEGKDHREAWITGYGFKGGWPFMLSLRSGAVAKLYIAPASTRESKGKGREVIVRDDDEDHEQVILVMETNCTPHFLGYISGEAQSRSSGGVRANTAVRLNAFDKLHAAQAPFLSRHFYLRLSLPCDTSQPGQPPTPNSLAALEAFLSSCTHLPSPIHLPSLDLLPSTKRFSPKGALRPLSQAFASVPPALAYHHDAILRDGTLSPAELRLLITNHVEPWMVTAPVPYGEGLTEEILIELRTRLAEDRSERKDMLALGKLEPHDLRQGQCEWELEVFAEAAREAVIQERKRVELEKAEKVEAGLPLGRGGENVMEDEGLFWSRSIVVTPSLTVKAWGRALEKTNAVLRKYYHPVEGHSERDYFLRIQFVDEDGQPLPSLSGYVWERLIDGSVGRILREGLMFAGRHYVFLAYSQSGLREGAVWFVAPWKVEQGGQVASQGAPEIRKDLGDFEKVSKMPAMLGARVSQAFTSSNASLFLHPHHIYSIEDITSVDENGVETACHTDGAGTMSLEARDAIWEALLKHGCRADPSGPAPSVFQIRLGGSKGILVLDKHLDGFKVLLRPSQEKFVGFPDDEHGTKWSLSIAREFLYPNGLRLNRPLISGLDDLGVSTEVFLRYQTLAIDELEPTNLETLFGAYTVLGKYQFGGATRFRSLLRSLDALTGIPDALLQQEPFLRNALNVVRARTLRDLKSSARIPLPGCYQLVGVPDEDSVLAENEIYACLRLPDKPNELISLEGRICITRSPVVDPGDIRVVRAIGKLPGGSALRMAGLVNCVVLPTVGKRSFTSMMGGGDCDGDVYDIITIAELVPERTVDPRPHESLPPRTLDCNANISDVGDHFVEYISKDTVGLIALTHLVYADYQAQGGLSPICQGLADLYSQAVDAPKKGNFIPREKIRKRPKGKPDFMRFSDFDVGSTRDGEYYESTRALGYLYRAIDDNSLKTPPELLNLAVTFDSSPQNPSWQVVRLSVERELTNALDCRAHHLLNICSSRSDTVLPVLNTFTAAINNICITHSRVPTSGRPISEEEIYAVTSLLEGDRHKAARGGLVTSMATEMSFHVRWLENELGKVDGNAALQGAEEEQLKLLYAAWICAVEKLDETESGVKTARWVCLALLLEALRRDVKRRELDSSLGPPSSAHASPPPRSIPPPPFSHIPTQLPTPAPSDTRPSQQYGAARTATALGPTSAPPIPLATRPVGAASVIPTPAVPSASSFPQAAQPFPENPSVAAPLFAPSQQQQQRQQKHQPHAALSPATSASRDDLEEEASETESAKADAYLARLPRSPSFRESSPWSVSSDGEFAETSAWSVRRQEGLEEEQLFADAEKEYREEERVQQGDRHTFTEHHGRRPYLSGVSSSPEVPACLPPFSPFPVPFALTSQLPLSPPPVDLVHPKPRRDRHPPPQAILAASSGDHHLYSLSNPGFPPASSNFAPSCASVSPPERPPTHPPTPPRRREYFRGAGPFWAHFTGSFSLLLCSSFSTLTYLLRMQILTSSMWSPSAKSDTLADNFFPLCAPLLGSLSALSRLLLATLPALSLPSIFTDSQRRYKSNVSGLGKLGRMVETADGRTYREACGIGRPSTPEHKRRRQRGDRSGGVRGGEWGAIGDARQRTQQEGTRVEPSFGGHVVGNWGVWSASTQEPERNTQISGENQGGSPPHPAGYGSSYRSSESPFQPQVQPSFQASALQAASTSAEHPPAISPSSPYQPQHYPESEHFSRVFSPPLSTVPEAYPPPLPHAPFHPPGDKQQSEYGHEKRW